MNRLFKVLPKEKQQSRLFYSTESTVLAQMKRHIAAGAEDAFYVVNTDAIQHKFDQWKQQLPRVHPFYAVKCNPDPRILATLADLGCSFDCASRPEIQAAMQTGARSDRIIYANPCKQISHIHWAREQNVDLMTFDNTDELDKMAAVYPSVSAVLRILVDDSQSQCQLGSKFGASLQSVPDLLRHASNLGINVMGISFHVGSGCYDATAYSSAVKSAKQAFDIAYDMGMNLSLLDIGGGFPGDDLTSAITFDQIAKELNTALDLYFPVSSGVEIIAEPGRFFAASSHTLATSIIGRKIVQSPSLSSNSKSMALKMPTRFMQTATNVPQFMYYVNDGIYGSFNCIMYDHATVSAQALEATSDATVYPSSIWGPTCDGLDCILKDTSLPQLDVGQWLYFNNMGAYTSAASSHFNGFAPPEKLYLEVPQEIMEVTY